MNSDKIKCVLQLAAQLVLSRGADVDTEDGAFATVCTDEIINLEMAISQAFELDSDDVTSRDIELICTEINSINF